MESFPVTCAVLACIIFSILWYISSTIKNRQKGVGYPLGIPFIGNITIFWDPPTITKKFFSLVGRYGPIVQLHLFSKRMFLISDPHFALEILQKRPKHFRRPRSIECVSRTLGLTSEMGVFTAEGVHWSKQRKLTSPSFSHKNVLEAADVVGNEINLLVDRLQQRLEMTNNHHGVKIIDMDNELAFFAQQTISSIAFGGLKGQVADYFQSLQLTNDLNAWFEYLYQRITFPFPAWLWRLSRFYQTERAARCADERISAHCRSIISSFREELCSEDSRMHTKKCLLLSLMRERSDTDIYLDDEELLANVKTFFIAGSDTTSVVITWMCFYFCTALQPMVTAIRNEIEHVLNKSEHVNGGCGIGIILAKNAANLPLCNAFMKEALRLSGPGAWIGAEYIGTEPLILSNGLKIYQSDEFFVFSDACGRDCSIFPNPDIFDPNRWINGKTSPDAQNLMEKAYIGFGGGPRLCPGCAASEISRKLSFISKANQMPIVLTPRI